METISLNFSRVKPRRDTLHGREYLVAPITLIVPGVLNGSQGPLYYPEEEISHDPQIWNGVPLVIRHPTHNGQAISARSPKAIDKFAVGSIYNAVANGKLKAEAWFDVARTRAVAPKVLEAVENGERLEQSTGLFTTNEPAPSGSKYQGTTYTHVARNYKPDHVAILPDQRGACSVQDGCGVNVNSRRSSMKQTRNAFCPTGEGGGQDNSCGSSSGQAGEERKSVSKFAVRDALVASEHATDLSLEMESGSHSKAAKAAMQHVKRGEHTEAAASHKNASELHAKAAEMLEKKPGTLATKDAIYKHQQAAKSHARAALYHSRLVSPKKSTNNRSSNNTRSPMTKNAKKTHEETVEFLVNSECCWNEEDRELLDGLDDAVLNRLRETAASVTERQKAAAVTLNAVKEAAEMPDCEDDELPEAVKNLCKKSKQPPAPVKNEAARLPSGEELVELLPAELREDLAFARNAKAQQKQQLVERLTVNIADAKARQAHQQRLAQRSLEDLQADVALLPTVNAQDEPAVLPFYAAPQPTTNRRTEELTDILALPVGQ